MSRRQGLRGQFPVVEAAIMADSSTDRGKRKRTRKLSDAGLPPMTSSAIQNLAVTWDDVPIVDGSLQLLPASHDNDDFSPITPRIVGGSDDSSSLALAGNNAVGADDSSSLALAGNAGADGS